MEHWIESASRFAADATQRREPATHVYGTTMALAQFYCATHCPHCNPVMAEWPGRAAELASQGRLF